MKKIPYLGRIVFLTLSITLAPWPQLSATIKQSTDEQGTIHINNIGEDTEKVKQKNYVPPPPAPPPARPPKSEVGKPQPPTPSNIFPKAEETDDEEDSKSPDDDE
jgi:hypothetical protein